jgi:hypothetical protein
MKKRDLERVNRIIEICFRIPESKATKFKKKNIKKYHISPKITKSYQNIRIFLKLDLSRLEIPSFSFLFCIE